MHRRWGIGYARGTVLGPFGLLQRGMYDVGSFGELRRVELKGGVRNEKRR